MPYESSCRPRLSACLHNQRPTWSQVLYDERSIKDSPRKARDQRPPLHLVPLALSVARGCARMVVGGTAAVAVGCGDRAEVNREQTLDGKFDVKDERRTRKSKRVTCLYGELLNCALKVW